MLKRIFVVIAAVMMLTSSGVAYGGSVRAISQPPTPDQALHMLLLGNRMFVFNQLQHLVLESRATVRTSLATGQKPYAVIISCSDSRVPPEIVFDKGLGEIFIIRVAGNVVAPHELGSIEYALEHLGASLVMVMGHERCGAVTAAVNYVPGTPTSPNILSLIDSIMPAVNAARDKHPVPDALVELSVEENVQLVATKLLKESAVINDKVEAGTVKIVKAKYDLDTGLVRILP